MVEGDICAYQRFFIYIAFVSWKQQQNEETTKSGFYKEGGY